MKPKSGSIWLALVALAAISIMTFGLACSQSQEAQQPETETAATDPPAAEAVTPVELPAEVAAILAKADGFDGSVDHVVSKCASCALAMDGSEEHALTHGEYKMHFCSEYCRDSFAKDTPTMVLAMNIPEPTQEQE